MTRSFALLVIAGACSFSCSSSPGTAATGSNPQAELRRLLVVADRSFDGRAYDEALDRYMSLYLAANSGGFDDIATESSAQVATVKALRDEFAESDRWMGLAEGSASSQDASSWSRVLLARGIRAWKLEDASRARGTFIELYNYCKLHDQTARAMQAANLTALVSLGEEQLDWSLRAIQTAQSAGEIKWEAPLWASHAWLLDDRGRYDDALRAFARARELTAESDVTPLGRLQADWAYAHGLRMVGRLAESRALLERTNSITHSIYIAKPSPRSAEWLGRILWEIGEVDADQGNKERARERFLAAREKLIEAGATEAAPDLIRELDERIAALDRPTNARRIPPKPRDG